MDRQERWKAGMQLAHKLVAERSAHYEDSYTLQVEQLRQRRESENAPTQKTDAIRISGIFKGPAHGRSA